MKLKLKIRDRCSEVGFDESTQLTAIFHGVDHEANAKIFMAAKELVDMMIVNNTDVDAWEEIENKLQKIIEDKNDPIKNRRSGGR